MNHYHTKMTRKGIIRFKDGKPSPLTNFQAKIIEEHVIHNADNSISRKYLITVKLDGKEYRNILVSAQDFESLKWIKEGVGADAIITTPSLNHEVANTIKLESKKRRIVHQYMRLGMLLGDTGMCYLNNGNIIFSDDFSIDGEIQVKLSGKLANYSFPKSTNDQKLEISSLRKLLEILNISSNTPALGTILLAAVTRAPLTEVHSTDFTAFIVGDTGSYKSAVAGVAQSAYGCNFKFNELPGSFSSTPLSTELEAITVQNALYGVDDYVPATGRRGEEQRTLVEILVRDNLNHSPRKRLHNGEQISPPPINAVILYTGEYVFESEWHSIHARILYCNVTYGDVDKKVLTTLQQAGKDGILSHALRAYIEYLLSIYKTLPRRLEKLNMKLREKAILRLGDASHGRYPYAVADAMLGISLFLSYCKKIGAISDKRFQKLRIKCWNNLIAQAKEQPSIIEHYSQHRILARSIGSLVKTGKYHILDAKSGECPTGLQKTQTGWLNKKPSGNLLGWLDSKKDTLYIPANFQLSDIYLQLPEKLRRSIPTGQKAFWSHLSRIGLLTETDICDGKNRVRRTFAGHERTSVYAVRASYVFDH